MFDKTRVMAVAKRFMDGSVDAEQFYKDLTLVIAEETGATRASLWYYPDPVLRDSIECLSLYDRTDAAWSAGAVLKEDDFGPYFEAMRKDGLIVAGDARANPLTSCFNEIYFDPLGIVSLLDVASTSRTSPSACSAARTPPRSSTGPRRTWSTCARWVRCWALRCARRAAARPSRPDGRGQPPRSCARSAAPISGLAAKGSVGLRGVMMSSSRTCTPPSACGWLYT